MVEAQCWNDKKTTIMIYSYIYHSYIYENTIVKSINIMVTFLER